MAAVIVSFRYVRGLALTFGLFFLIGGGSLLIISRATPADVIFSFGGMIQMVTLFALVPILALPVRLGDYAKEVNGFIKENVKNERQFYILSSSISYIFSSFMNLAALPLTYYSIQPSAGHFSLSNEGRYFNRSITHGYAMPLLWSPATPIVGTVLSLTDVRYTSVFLYLFLLSLAGLVLDWCLVALPFKTYRRRLLQAKIFQNEIAAPLDEEIAGFRPSRLFHILIAILLLDAMVALLDHFFKLGFTFFISILVIPFALSWSVLIKKTGAFFSGVKKHFRTYFIKMENQFFIFLSAGFFIAALRFSHADVILTHWVDVFIGFIGPRMFLVLLPLFPLALAFVGLHPAVGLALLSEAIRSNLLSHAPVVVTIAMLGGAVPAFLMGPYNATLGMMSSITGEKPWKLSNWNFPFTCAYLALLMLLLTFSPLRH